jgi:hypothetical protein
MSHSKPISKAKGRRRAVTALGVAGALSLAGGASASIATGGIATQNTAPVILAEEEISDVSLATFYVFDKENAGSSRHGVRLACGCWTPITRPEMMLMRPHLVRLGTRSRRSAFRKPRSKHAQAQQPT